MKSKAKILLVDDDKDFVEATAMVLESKPYEVVVAYDGDDGLAKARKEKPDLIILDISMRGVQSLETVMFLPGHG